MLPRLAKWLPGRVETLLPYPDCMTEIRNRDVRACAEEYLRAIEQLLVDEPLRVVDKQLANVVHLGLIAVLFPKARVIHCTRDPMDVCVSIYFQRFVRGNPYSYRLEDIAWYWRQNQRLMAHWRSVLPIEMLEVPYAAMVAQPEETIRRIIEYCGLEWDERCLRFYESENPMVTASAFQVREPIYTSAQGRWKRYEKHLGVLKEGVGENVWDKGA